MNILKKLAAAALTGAVLISSGCLGFGSTEGLTPNPIYSYDYSTMKLVQLEEPAEGSPVAVIETTAGTIKAVLYPQYAPNTVSNFVNRAKEGFYNGKDIYCVIDKSIFMAGAADENRNTGLTEDGELIANEYSVDLWPFKGALCSYNGHSGYGDSRFMVLNERELSEEDISTLRELKNKNEEKLLPDTLVDAFVEYGVVIDFTGAYTVFAQTFEGMDIIEKICSVPVSGELSMPVDPIYINSITITEYHKA
ncbi:MAG: peptidylprolyl isomerase [Ruminiclostridium sp.]|nr:peptidylprolyl isomerase [Ruminiclostridium sp.]